MYPILWKTIYAFFELTHEENIMMVYLNEWREFTGILIFNWITEDTSNHNKIKKYHSPTSTGKSLKIIFMVICSH